MKKLFVLFVISGLALSTSVFAHGNAHGNAHSGHRSHGWIAPVVIGGAIGYGFARQYPPYYYSPQVVYVQPAPVVVQQQQPQLSNILTCTAWTETQLVDGTISRTRICTQ